MKEVIFLIPKRNLETLRDPDFEEIILKKEVLIKILSDEEFDFFFSKKEIETS